MGSWHKFFVLEPYGRVVQGSSDPKAERRKMDSERGKTSKRSHSLKEFSTSEKEQAKFDKVQVYFSKARGKIFKRLLNIDPETLWMGLCRMPSDEQMDFLNRIPFDSPVKPILEQALRDENKPVPGGKGNRELGTIIYYTELEDGLEEREKIHEMVLSKLNHVETLPTLPSIANQVMRLVSDPDSSIADLTEIIIKDPSLTSKTLQVVNSASYGFYRKIGTVKQAVALLGTGEVSSIAFALTAAKVINTSSIGHLYSPKGLWHHSMATGLICQHMCRQFPEFRTSGAFTAGLLHDFGKIFLIQNFPDIYGKVHSEIQENDIPVFELEEELFGINHAFIGEYLATNWNLPEALVQAIAFHHQPASASNYSELAALIGLADYLYHQAALTGELPKEAPSFPAKLSSVHFEILSGLFKKLDVDHLKTMTQKAIDIIQENSEIFNILS